MAQLHTTLQALIKFASHVEECVQWGDKAPRFSKVVIKAGDNRGIDAIFLYYDGATTVMSMDMHDMHSFTVGFTNGVQHAFDCKDYRVALVYAQMRIVDQLGYDAKPVWYVPEDNGFAPRFVSAPEEVVLAALAAISDDSTKKISDTQDSPTSSIHQGHMDNWAHYIYDPKE